MVVYINKVDYAEHVALIKGEIPKNEPVLVRMHALNILSDIVGDNYDGKDGDLHHSMQMISDAGTGIIVLIRDLKKTTISDSIRKRLGHLHEESGDLRDYGIGAQILLDLGIKDMTLITNSKRMIVGLEGYGLSVAGYMPIPRP